MIGLFVQGRDARSIVDAIKRAESMNIPAVWLTMGGVGPDSPSIFAAAAVQTERVKFGTSIIPTWPRHPLSIAQQAITLASLAPGRFRLGVGPSHQPGMEAAYGVRWRTPLTQLREYLTVLQSLFKDGNVDFTGKFVTARARLAAPMEVPVLASALRAGSFRTCGELADGAISWVAPWDYLRDKALPAIKEGAASAGRTPPPLIAHVPVCVHGDAGEARAAAREQIGFYARVPFYAAMYAAAGFDDAPAGLSDRLIDALVLHGSEERVTGGLRRILAQGAGEIIAHPILAGGDRAKSLTRTMETIAAANRA